VQEKVQSILAAMLRDEDNKYCVDCDSKGPRWASWNLGVFLCIRCAGIHRNLGVHISKVKSVNLDSWTPQQVSSMQAMGNSKGRAVYEANLPEDFKRPQTDSAVEAFIRQKYEKKKFIAAEWVPTKPPDVPVGWDTAGQEVPGKSKTEASTSKKLILPTPPVGGVSPRLDKPAAPSKAAPVSPRLTVALPPAKPSPASTSTVTISATEDLLGLSIATPASSSLSPQTNSSQSVTNATGSASSDLLGLNSDFSFVSASPASTNIPANTTGLSAVQNEPNLPPPTSQSGKMSTDSIMALFGNKPSVPVQQAMFPPSQSANTFSVPSLQGQGAALMGQGANLMGQGTNLINNPFLDPLGPNQAGTMGLGQVNNQFVGLNLGAGSGGVNLPNKAGLGLWQ